ncbi:hypothetical protein PR048_031416 [Dryococelus australis]|uniref:Uncharacterized protein n=1 Tax=Dryococelus australis TaxID=614101 RepID=A0ABQ9G888_9NEOP|nr:hypothetical protein PR048_031416 [Dryococelus australis]
MKARNVADCVFVTETLYHEDVRRWSVCRQRTVIQPSPSTVTADNQCTIDIGIFVHKTGKSSLQAGRPGMRRRNGRRIIIIHQEGSQGAHKYLGQCACPGDRWRCARRPPNLTRPAPAAATEEGEERVTLLQEPNQDFRSWIRRLKMSRPTSLAAHNQSPCPNIELTKAELSGNTSEPGIDSTATETSSSSQPSAERVQPPTSGPLESPSQPVINFPQLRVEDLLFDIIVFTSALNIQEPKMLCIVYRVDISVQNL